MGVRRLQGELSYRIFFAVLWWFLESLCSLRPKSDSQIHLLSQPWKALTTHAEKYDIFSGVFNIANQLLTRQSPFTSVVDEWTASLHHSQFKVVCRNVLGLWLLKHWKIRIADRQWHSNFPKRGSKPKYQKKKPKVTYSVPLVMAFLTAENENRLLEDLSIFAVCLKDFFCW